MTDQERPDRQEWPRRDLPQSDQRQSDLSQPATEAGPIRTQADWDPEQGERRRPTTAEQAVPWLIGLILALSGIMIVLVALIFTGPEGLVAGLPTPSPTPNNASFSPAPTATPEPTATPVPTAIPTFAPLEMVYLGKASRTAEFDLMRRDFAVDPKVTAPEKVADGSAGGLAFAWSPDGLLGAAIIGGNAWAVVPGQPPRSLLLNVSALVFSDDSTTLYAMRITADGTDDHADLFAIDVLTGQAQKVATVGPYPHPLTSQDPVVLHRTQFLDDGGVNRLYFTVDGYVLIYVKGAPSIYRIDPVTGAVTTAQHLPTLWSPDQELWVELSERNSTLTRVILHHRDGSPNTTVNAPGVVSHVRWAPNSLEIVLTLSYYGTGSTVLSDLYVWDVLKSQLTPLTSNGLARGAEWLSAPQVWLP